MRERPVHVQTRMPAGNPERCCNPITKDLHRNYKEFLHRASVVCNEFNILADYSDSLCINNYKRCLLYTSRCV